MYHDSQPRPSVYERPVLKLRFTTPDGQAHQSTITSSWLGSVGFTERGFTALDDKSVQFRKGIASACGALCLSVECNMISLEFVSTSVMDLE